MDVKQIYTQWLNEPELEESLKAELSNLPDDEISDRFYTGLSFGTAGMRGIIAAGTNRMNVHTVMRATKGLALYILSQGAQAAARGVVISYDSRKFSDKFARLAAEVLAYNKIKVYLFDSIHPVPILSYAIRRLNAISGIMITASHNPAEYNGYKVYWEDGAQLSLTLADCVADVISKVPYFGIERLPIEEAGAYIEIIGKKIDDDYIECIKKLSVRSDILKEYADDLKLVYTPLHGAGRMPVSRILKEIGVINFTMVKEQELPDSAFSTVKLPNPEFVEAFEIAIRYADAVHADVIVGTDPDADRMGVVIRTKDGAYTALTGNQIGCILLHYILSQKAQTGKLPKDAYTIKSIVSTEMARAIAGSFGCECVDVLTGFKFVGEQILKYETDGNKHSFMFAFEESYGFLCGSYARDKDGVSAAMMISEVAAYALSKGETLADYLQHLYDEYGYYAEFTHSKNFPGIEGMKDMQALMDKVRAHIPKELGGFQVEYADDILASKRISADGSVTDIDIQQSNVLRFTLQDNAWAAIRPSGTEPKIKIYGGVRGKDKAETEKLAGALKDALEKFLN